MEETTDSKITSEITEAKPVNKKLINQFAAAAIIAAGILGFSAFNPEFKLKVNAAVKQNISFAELREKAAKYVSIINFIKNPFAPKDDGPGVAPNVTPKAPEELKTNRIDFEALEALEPGAEY
jgi:hypothetical protein